MGAQVKSDLFDLIKSLSKSEKRYYKLFAARHVIGEENNYNLLFDFVEGLKEYDEEKIEQHFKGHPFLKRFSMTKKRLFDHILQSLDAFHAASSVEAQLYRMLHSAEILYKKALYDSCASMLNSAEKLAIKEEKFHILLEIRLCFKRLIENESYSTISKKEIQQHLEDDLHYIEVISSYNRLWNVKSLLFSKLNQEGVARSEEDKNEYKQLVDELKKIPESQDFDSQYLRNHTRSAYFFAVDDTSSSLLEIHKNISLFQANSRVIQAEPNVYFSALTNAIYSHHAKGEYEEAYHFLGLLKSLPQQLGNAGNEDLDIKLFSSINSIELNLLNARGEFLQATDLEPIIEEGYRLYGKKISRIRRAYLGFSLAVAFFGNEDYAGALKWINVILNDPELDQKEDIFCFAQLFNLVIHFELKHQQLLPYAIQNAHRYLKTRNRVFAFESVFFKYLNKIIKAPSEVNKIELIGEVAIELEELRTKPYEKGVFDYFNFALWAKAKAQNTSFAELAKNQLAEVSK